MLDNEQIKEFRKMHHLSQDEIAQVLGISRATWIRWEKGTTLPKATKQKQLLAYINSVDSNFLNRIIIPGEINGYWMGNITQTRKLEGDEEPKIYQFPLLLNLIKNEDNTVTGYGSIFFFYLSDSTEPIAFFGIKGKQLSKTSLIVEYLKNNSTELVMLGSSTLQNESDNELIGNYNGFSYNQFEAVSGTVKLNRFIAETSENTTEFIEWSNQFITDIDPKDIESFYKNFKEQTKN